MQVKTFLPEINQWRLPNFGFLLLDPVALKTIIKYRQISALSTEAGGLIYGYDRHPHIQICGVSEPNHADLRQRNSWRRLDVQHLQLLNTTAINPTNVYLGEWHSHPEDNPKPSRLDIKEWLKIGSINPDYRYVFLVIGRKNLTVHVCYHGRLTELKPFN